MNRKALPALVALNVVLLMSLLVVSLTPSPAKAQFGRARYVMISGQAQGQNQRNAVYIIEVNQAKMVAMMFNGGNNKLEIIAGRKLADDMKAQVGRPGVRGR